MTSRTKTCDGLGGAQEEEAQAPDAVEEYGAVFCYILPQTCAIKLDLNPSPAHLDAFWLTHLLSAGRQQFREGGSRSLIAGLRRYFDATRSSMQGEPLIPPYVCCISRSRTHVLTSRLLVVAGTCPARASSPGQPPRRSPPPPHSASGLAREPARREQRPEPEGCAGLSECARAHSGGQTPEAERRREAAAHAAECLQLVVVVAVSLPSAYSLGCSCAML